MKDVEEAYTDQQDSMCLVKYLQNILMLENKKKIEIEKEIKKLKEKYNRKLNDEEKNNIKKG